MRFSLRHFVVGYIAGWTLGMIRNPVGSIAFTGLLVAGVLLAVSC